MPDGTFQDPIKISPVFPFLMVFLTHLDESADDFVHAVSPKIRANVEPGQYFVFTGYESTTFYLGEEDGKLYFVPATRRTNAWRWFLTDEDTGEQTPSIMEQMRRRITKALDWDPDPVLK